MKKLYIFLVLASLCSFVNAQSLDGIKGSWQGSIAVSGVELGIIFKISVNGDKIEAKMDVPMQGAKDIPAEEASFKNDSLRLNFKKLGASYSGVLNKSERSIDGSWKQSGQSFPLKLTPQTTSTGFKRPQEPAGPFPYRQEEVSFTNKTDGVTLAGTLTIPEGKGKYPVAVLISGSGTQNRDEEIMGHKPFLVLADHLTRKGIAVLRFDDRGAGKSTGDPKNATSFDFSKDVMAAVSYLRTRKDIDKTKIGLIGHSEGGMIAPMVAANDKDIAFIVLLAGPGMKGDELLASQTKALLLASGVNAYEQAVEINRTAYKLAVMEPQDTAQAQLNRYMKQASLNDPAMQGQADALLSPWMRYFLKYDPSVALSEVKCPVLAINGDKDVQVIAKENLEGIQAALKKGGNDRCTVKIFPGLNHLFQQCTTGLPAEYAMIEETISPAVLREVEEWITGTLKLTR